VKKNFQSTLPLKKKETVIQSMKDSYGLYFGLCSVIIAALLLLAVPAAAMGMAPGADSCSTPGFLSVSGENMKVEKDPHCQKNCYDICANTCSDGWCMFTCTKNCDKYCEKQ